MKLIVGTTFAAQVKRATNAACIANATQVSQ